MNGNGTVPEWILDPTPEKLVAWLDEMYSVEIDPRYVDDHTVQSIAHSRARDGSLNTIAMMGERGVVDGSAMLIMADAAKNGTHHNTPGEWSTPMEWFLSKVEGDNEWSETMMRQLEGIINVVIPAMRAAGITEEEILLITENESKARKSLSTMRPLLQRLNIGRDEDAEEKVRQVYNLIVGPRSVSYAEEEFKKIRGYVPPEPVQVQQAWLSDSENVVIIRCQNGLQRRALYHLLEKIPHEQRDVDLVAAVQELLSPLTE